MEHISICGQVLYWLLHLGKVNVIFCCILMRQTNLCIYITHVSLFVRFYLLTFIYYLSTLTVDLLSIFNVDCSFTFTFHSHVHSLSVVNIHSRCSFFRNCMRYAPLDQQPRLNRPKEELTEVSCILNFIMSLFVQ